jgi:glycosyltransferase involved in cell wall biosynthesis
MIDAIAAIGDAADIRCWSGIPFYFGRAARARGEAALPWRLPMDSFRKDSFLWNLGRVLAGQRFGGYQYSEAFLDWAERTVPATAWQGRIFSFSQHFPRSRSAASRGGRTVRYIDSTFASFCQPGGLEAHLPARVRGSALESERENYAGSERVVTMARWAAESAIRDCGVPPAKVDVILPGANVELPSDYSFPVEKGRPGLDRPLVLGFVGKDWKRKGLRFLLQVRAMLERMGLHAVVRCAGRCPAELDDEGGLEYAGFIDKRRDVGRFLEFVAGCDLGCLFSEHEPLGISTLEFLRAGVPVAGFTVEGVADTVPPDAGFRFEPGTGAEAVASALRAVFLDDAAVESMRAAARKWSPLVTWERCVDEWRQLLATGAVADPVQPWRGLKCLT